MDIKLNNRRINAKDRLEAQLKKGKKPALVTTANGSAVWQDVSLTDTDIKRIKKEIDILKAKIVILS